MGRLVPSVRSQSAFTLIEVLVVLVVLAIATRMLMLSLAENPWRSLKREQDRLEMLLKSAREEAELQRILIGLQIGREGYQFALYDAEKRAWLKYSQKPYAPYRFPQNIVAEMDWSLDELSPREQKALQNLLADQNGSGEITPNVVVLPSGELSPFKVELLHIEYNDILLSTDHLALEGLSQ